MNTWTSVWYAYIVTQVTSMRCYFLFGLNWLGLGNFLKPSDKAVQLFINKYLEDKVIEANREKTTPVLL